MTEINDVDNSQPVNQEGQLMDGFERPVGNLLASSNQSDWIEGRTWLQVPVTNHLQLVQDILYCHLQLNFMCSYQYWYWSHPVKAARRRTRTNFMAATKLVGVNRGLREVHQLN